MKKNIISQNMIENLLAILIAVIIAVPAGLLMVNYGTETSGPVHEARKIDSIARFGKYIELFGRDGYYTDDEPIKGYFYHRDYYIADYDENCFYKVGEAWGFEIEDYVVDIDGDGADELVCNCMWGGDGVREVYVYKLKDEYLWIGNVNEDACEIPEFFENASSSFQSWYVESKNAVYIQYDIDAEGHHETRVIPPSFIKFIQFHKLEPDNDQITHILNTAADYAEKHLLAFPLSGNGEHGKEDNALKTVFIPVSTIKEDEMNTGYNFMPYGMSKFINDETIFKDLTEIVKYPPLCYENVRGRLAAFARYNLPDYTNIEFLMLYTTAAPEHVTIIHSGLTKQLIRFVKNRFYPFNSPDTKMHFFYTPIGLDAYEAALSKVCPKTLDAPLLRDGINLLNFKYAPHPYNAFNLNGFATAEDISKFDKNSLKLFCNVNKIWNNINDVKAAYIYTMEYHKVHEAFENLKDTVTKRWEDLDASEHEKEKIINKTTKQIAAYGHKGEFDVNYVLKWFPGKYIVIGNNTVDAFGYECVKVASPKFRNEPQQIDSICVTNRGVILTEVKTLKGQLEIDSEGNWLHTKKNGEMKGIPSPTHQVFRHEQLIRSILPDDIPIISIICMGNDAMILRGKDNSPYPVVLKNDLCHYIMELPISEIMTSKKIEEVADTIRAHYAS